MSICAANTLDVKCTEATNIPISYTCAVISVILVVFTVPSNFTIILSIMRKGRLLQRNFYFIICNIAIADLVCAILTGPISINLHMKQTNPKYHFPEADKHVLHLSFFITNGVSVLSMAALSIDRLGVLLYPFFYYEKVTRFRTMVILLLTWVVSLGMGLSYLCFGYIRYLTIFSVMTVMLTMLVMIATMVLFKYRLMQSIRTHQFRPQPASSSSSATNADPPNMTREGQHRSLNHFTQVDQKITKTFLWMLLLFLVNYLPAMIAATYINICTDCPCSVVHLMRDVVFLSILTSGLFRAVLFISRLEVLRTAICEMAGRLWESVSSKDTIQRVYFRSSSNRANADEEGKGMNG